METKEMNKKLHKLKEDRQFNINMIKDLLNKILIDREYIFENGRKLKIKEKRELWAVIDSNRLRVIHFTNYIKDIESIILDIELNN